MPRLSALSIERDPPILRLQTWTTCILPARPKTGWTTARAVTLKGTSHRDRKASLLQRMEPVQLRIRSSGSGPGRPMPRRSARSGSSAKLQGDTNGSPAKGPPCWRRTTRAAVAMILSGSSLEIPATTVERYSRNRLMPMAACRNRETSFRGIRWIRIRCIIALRSLLRSAAMRRRSVQLPWQWLLHRHGSMKRHCSLVTSGPSTARRFRSLRGRTQTIYGPRALPLRSAITGSPHSRYGERSTAEARHRPPR